ncbi:HupE/UreJ family protein [Luteolibacter ambystomatis]|uniref:HupE/UreJ family protein n=1 Tax=Luteolibacter ambystomatis TaxID=2824561 RepID=A0A975G6K8_9BACT|nr:HupE/UreJ family protein [Luteolibacter ambystomatis]QUE49745.1 HupE/UreJ family protein [Luteolibacter ambystomatis]
MKRPSLIPVIAASLLGTGAANAHVITTGLGPLYDGATHLALSPEDCVPLVALGLFAGLRGPDAARRAFFVIPAAWLAGGWLGLSGGMAPAFPIAAASFLVLGLLIATDCKMKPAWVAALAGLISATHAWLDGVAVRAEGGEHLGTLGGAITATVFFLLSAGLVLALKPGWTRIVVRVLGSWIAATGLLMAGWWIHTSKPRPPKPPQGAARASIFWRASAALSACPALSAAAASPFSETRSAGKALRAPS